MDAKNTAPDRWKRLPAQVAVVLGLFCAAGAFYWDSGLPSLLLAVTGVVLALLGAWLTPDGWLVDPEDGR